MILFSRLSFRLKLIALLTTTTALALLLAWTLIIMTDYASMKRQVAIAARTQADIVGQNTTAAIAFGDAEAARGALESLRSVPEILAASIRTPDGETLASFGAGDHDLPLAEFDADGHFFDGRTMHVSRVIRHEGDVIGRIIVVHDLNGEHRLLARKSMLVLGVLVGSLFISTMFAMHLQRSITRPVHELSKTARRVSEDGDYSVRAARTSDDELGRLVTAFNSMLGQIQERDDALEAARSDLEARVSARTRDLVDANEVLQKEIRERRRAEIQLREAQTLMTACIEQSPAGIVIADAPDVDIRIVNAAALRIAGVETDLVVGAEAERHPELWRVVRPDGSACDTEELPLTRAVRYGETSGVSELILRRADGDDRWITAQAAPVRDDSGHITAGVVVFTDITEQRQVLQERMDMQKQLVETSRLAGMAEVATGVLHNVGNILNSVNVSATLVIDRMRESSLEDVRRIADLLNEHRGDLAGFIASDERGSLIPEFLDQLATHCSNERTESLSELTSLVSRIEHIKEIVSMQQSYSKISGAVEKVSLVELIKDAIRINEAGFARHGVEVVCELGDDAAEANTDRHKVLQILVNLLNNAKYALESRPSGERRLRIALRRDSDARCAFIIEVADNGMGITQENLTKIFTHGFTTRKHGHGFGLHSGALSAQILGGELSATSDGPGRGATFTLTLPRHTPREAT
jgi:PAS domain S-box-containing protein